MHKVAVLIPAYNESLNEFELSSLHQCNLVLNNFPKILVCYNELNTGIYEKCIPGIKYEYFDRGYFKNIDEYSRLLLSFEFYNRFREFEYILIYQLDAWVFRDELEYWCEKGYDYIGAPWFENYGFHEKGNKLWTVGNGGFSLRRVHTFLDVLNFQKPLFKRDGFQFIYPDKKSVLKNIKRNYNILSIRIGLKNKIRYYIKKYKGGEDTFWAVFLLKSEKSLKIPDCKEALAFSFEKSPGYLYELAGMNLPFGCHAWEKHDYDTFWKNFIRLGN